MVRFRRNSSWSKSFTRSLASTARTRFSSTRDQEPCLTGSSISECRTATTAKSWSLSCMHWHVRSTMQLALRTISSLKLIARQRIAFSCASICTLRAFPNLLFSAQSPAIDFSSFLSHIARAQPTSTSSPWSSGRMPTLSTNSFVRGKSSLTGTIGSFGRRLIPIKCSKKPMGFSKTGATSGWAGTSSSLCQCS